MDTERNELDARIVGGHPCPPYQVSARILAALLRIEDQNAAILAASREASKPKRGA